MGEIEESFQRFKESEKQRKLSEYVAQAREAKEWEASMKENMELRRKAEKMAGSYHYECE